MTSTRSTNAEFDADNPFAEPSPLPFGAPRFDAIRDEHHRPALLEGIRRRAAEVRAIAGSAAPPTFENTVEALELAGELLGRARGIFQSLTSAHTNATLQAVENELAPLLARHQDDVYLDPALFARIDAVWERRDELADPEARRLVERYRTEFVRNGAQLDDASKARLRAINEELSSLQTTFGEKLLADTNALAVEFDSSEALRGLPASSVSAAADRAKAAGKAGRYLLGLQLPTSQGTLGSLEDRDARRRVHEASWSRCRRGGANDTRELARRMAELRAERAALFGYASHAEWVLADETAGSPEAVGALFDRMVPRIVAKAEEERRELESWFAVHAPGATFEPWDWSFAAERLREERFDLDDAEVRAYFPLERVLEEGVFHMARELYGVEMRERTDLPVYHPDVRVWEVVGEDGATVGLFYGDWFARESKRGGAWMTSYAEQNALRGELPLVANVMNVPKPAPGEPALMSFDEVTTMFHEFGHAVHGLFSRVRFPFLSGTNVPRDFVEFPSQFHEDFAFEPEVLARVAKHHETGAPMPQELVDKVRASRRFGQGFDALEYVAAALLDLAWHTLRHGDRVDDVEAFERAALERAGVANALVPPRYSTPYFMHVFGGGYSAGYYAYMWSEALAADGYRRITEDGGMTRANGARYRDAILSRGFTREPMEMYREFRGRDLDPHALLVRRGLVTA
ncbi:MAG: M3 family metallopeptidase [Planctomycetota bacterium]